MRNLFSANNIFTLYLVATTALLLGIFLIRFDTGFSYSYKGYFPNFLLVLSQVIELPFLLWAILALLIAFTFRLLNESNRFLGVAAILWNLALLPIIFITAVVNPKLEYRNQIDFEGHRYYLTGIFRTSAETYSNLTAFVVYQCDSFGFVCHIHDPLYNSTLLFDEDEATLSSEDAAIFVVRDGELYAEIGSQEYFVIGQQSS